MHRVLSFQMARGFGESSEFVTKRMCFSFLFSVGFLSLLCGFLMGRFAAGRAIDVRAEKARLRLAGNGLDSTEHLRESLLQRLQENTFDDAGYVTKNGSVEDVLRIKETLLGLQFFHRVVGNRSCIVASIRGTLEPDRYVALSGSDEGVALVVELARALKALNKDYDWLPRRSLKFLISLESPNACQAALPSHVRRKVVGYVALDVRSIGESGYFVATGTDLVRSTILQAAAGVKNPNYKNNLGESPMITEGCEEASCPGPIPRLRLDIPNAALTFVNFGSTSGEHPKYINGYRQALAKVIGTSVWRLSEMTLLQWDPRAVNNALIDELQALDSPENAESVRKIVAEIREMTDKTVELNANNDRMERTKSLEVRIANDLSMELSRVLLCCDDELRSISDRVVIARLEKNSNATRDILSELLSCYETANEILQEDVT